MNDNAHPVRMTIRDHREIALLEAVGELPLEAQKLLVKRLVPLVEAMADREPAHVVRRAALDVMRAAGASDAVAVERVDRWMRDSIGIRKSESRWARSTPGRFRPGPMPR